MRYYFAPMEGLTDSIYRRLHHKYFPSVDRYYMPFISPTMHHSLTAKERRDLPPADEAGFTAIPQILTKVPEDFLWAAEQCRLLGYGEVNLNMGCPSGTVVSKGKGAGLLYDTHALNEFLDRIFSSVTIGVSVKTRIGLRSPEEFPEILEILNRCPIRELTVHPRVRADFYKGKVDMAAFSYAADHAAAPLCYNGDIRSREDIAALEEKYPSLPAVMIGRALIADPGMLTEKGTDRKSLSAFHTELMEEYCRAFGSERNAMFRLKEDWGYMLCLFAGAEKLGKALRKTTRIEEYRSLTQEILTNLPMVERPEMNW